MPARRNVWGDEGGNRADREGMRTNGHLLVLTPLTRLDENLPPLL